MCNNVPVRRSLLVRPRSAGGLSFFFFVASSFVFLHLDWKEVITIRLSNAKPFQRDSVAIVRYGVIRRVHHFHGQILCLNCFRTRRVLSTGLLTGTYCRSGGNISISHSSHWALGRFFVPEGALLA